MTLGEHAPTRAVLAVADPRDHVAAVRQTAHRQRNLLTGGEGIDLLLTVRRRRAVQLRRDIHRQLVGFAAAAVAIRHPQASVRLADGLESVLP